MKKLIIEINSFILYAALAVLVVFGFIVMGTSSNPMLSAALVGAGFIGWCLVTGLWFLLVAIHEELVKLNKKGI